MENTHMNIPVNNESAVKAETAAHTDIGMNNSSAAVCGSADKKSPTFADKLISSAELELYKFHLIEEDLSTGTIDKYMRDMENFKNWLQTLEEEYKKACSLREIPVCKWKNFLIKKGYASITINSMIGAVNNFLKLRGLGSRKLSAIKIQRQIFREPRKDLNQEEYQKLINSAYKEGKIWLARVMEALGNTGIRVSELGFITVEAVEAGRVEIYLKKKRRTIIFSSSLCRKLLRYAKEKGITAGCIFCEKDGTPITRLKIWKAMKEICKKAGVAPSKVFPHNLRHLFAVRFYEINHDIVKLADLLGHSNIETTRLYLKTTGEEHLAQMEKMGMLESVPSDLKG